MKKNIQEFPRTGRYISRIQPGIWREKVRSQRFLATLLGISLFWSVEAPGLGLGDIELNSHLNQPLDAEISLLAVDANQLDQISVKLADYAAHEAAGIERVEALSELIFNVSALPGGGVEIDVTTKGNVREPFLDFIIEVNWPNGRILREYTLLLDPPVFTAQQAFPVASPEVGFTLGEGASDNEPVKREQPTASQPKAVSSSNEAAPETPAVAASTRTLSNNGVDPLSTPRADGQLRVKRHETLWDIANSILPQSGFSTEQKMLGIYRVNPEAFIQNNINNLKAGYVLRTPSEAAVAELSKNEAAQLARQHYQSWLNAKRLAAAGGSRVAEATPGPAGLADSSGRVATKAVSKGRLSVVSPSDADLKGAAGAGSGNMGGLSSSDMALVLEQAKASQAESEALKSRISALEKQLATMERLITLKDDALVELQRQLDGSPNQMATVTDIEPLEPVAVDPEPVEVAVTESSGVEENSVPVAKAQPKKAPVQPAPAAEEEAGILEMLVNPQILMLGVGILLVIAAALLFIRKRREASDDYEYHDFEPNYDQALAGMDEVTEDATASVSEDMDFSELTEDALADLPEAEEFTSSGMDSFQADEVDIDPIAEADVYLAYRRFQQAEDLIKEAMQGQPDRHDLQAKLLEIYFAADNKAGFEAQSEALFASLGGQENSVWRQVVEMGRELCPGHPLFGGSQEAGDVEVVDDFSSLTDIDSAMEELSDTQDLSGELASADLEAAVSDDLANMEFDTESFGEDFVVIV